MMRNVLRVAVLVLAACSNKSSEKPPDPEAERLAFERTIAEELKSTDGVAEVNVTATELQVIAQPDTCRQVHATLLRATRKYPKGFTIMCGVVGNPPVWKLRERAGELLEARY